MKTPLFWYKKKSLFSLVLFPMSMLWLLVSFLRTILKKKNRFNIPIICVGNAIAGGGGKTPLILEICKLYNKKNISVHVVYKAYKVKFFDKVIKVLSMHTSKDVGDEPILIAQYATTWVCKKRIDGIIAAIDDQADLVLLDDGLQDNSISKSLNILVANENQRNGNNFIIPAGPLREPINSSLNKSDCIFFYGQKIIAKKLFYSYKKEIFLGNIVINRRLSDYISSKKIVAFAGIAHPDNFFNLLSNNKLNIVKKIYFPDHYTYRRKDILKIINFSINNSAKILTTSKDYTKVPDDLKKYISIIEISVKFNKKIFLNFLNKKIGINV